MCKISSIILAVTVDYSASLWGLKPRNHETTRKQGRSKVRDALVSIMDTIVRFQHGTKQTLGMLNVIVTFQDGADLELAHTINS